MARTISTTINAGLTLEAADSPLTIASFGAVVAGAGDAIVGDATQPWTVVNAGTVSGQYGITFAAIGSITNAGVIAGSNTGLGVGVFLSEGGSVVNETGGTISGYSGAYFFASGAITNSGFIIGGTGANAAGIELKVGGSVSNSAGGTISGYSGIVANGLAVTIVNAGLILGGVALYGGGTLFNGGTVIGDNAGAVRFSGTNAARVVLTPGFAFQGLVSGGAGTNSVELAASQGSAVGTLSGFGDSFVQFGTIEIDPGSNWILDATNTVAAATILIDQGTLTNTGAIGTTVTVTIGASLNNAGLITGSQGQRGPIGVYAGTASQIGTFLVDNEDGGTISGYDGIVSLSFGSISNSGHITGGGKAYAAGVYLISGYIANLSGGVISAYNGAFLKQQGSVINQGIILAGEGASSNAIILLHGGSAFNEAGGTLSGYTGVYGTGSATTVINAGSIAAEGTVTMAGVGGIALSDGGTIFNLASGVVTGAGEAVVIAGGPGTLSDSGTIIGGAGGAIQFDGSFSDRLILNPGFAIHGSIVGGSGSNVLELAADGTEAGTLSGLATQFAAFPVVTLDAQADWDISGGVRSAQTILLAAGATLGLSNPATMAGTIAGFAAGETIVLPTIAYQSGDSTNLSTDHALVVTLAGGGTVSLKLDPQLDYAGQFFHLAADGSGTAITTDNVPCYVRGTLIRTETGDVAIEDLRIGDRVMTRSGHGAEQKPIRWIGRRCYEGGIAAHRRDVLPVRIRAGALGDDVPRRDLYVSPAHAVFLRNVLVPARKLLNGASIVQVSAAERVEYFHLELESHDLILAEGAVSETFVDDDSRALFDNAADYAGPRLAVRPAYCAQRVEGGPALEALRAELTRRAILLGHAPCRDWTLRLDRAGTLRGVLPPDVQDVRLVSAAQTPSGERRRLGAALGGLTLDDQPIALDDPRLCDGFHPIEREADRAWRWTDGAGVLRIDPQPTWRELTVDVISISECFA